MPSKSKAQQRFMGMVRSAQKGGKQTSDNVAKVAKSIDKCDSEDFGLCTYIDASKMNISRIIQDGLNYIEEEA